MAEQWDPAEAEKATRLIEVDPEIVSGARDTYVMYVALRMANFNQAEACTIVGVMLATSGSQDGDVGG